MSSTARSSTAVPQFNRTLIYISLGIAVVFIVAVLVGARIISEQAGDQPVAMSDLPAPEADSQECSELISQLPDELLGHDRAEIAEPAPAGAAAWQSSSLERITLRCGIDLPFQYTEYASTHDIDGVEWLRVDDMTPESDMSTWYAVDRSPVVAVTADGRALDGADNPVEDLGGVVGELPEHNHDPHPAPLSELEPAAEDASDACRSLGTELPDILADGWTHATTSQGDTAVWANEGAEPIVVRCGVAPPPNYQPGEQLTQIDDIPWFEDERLVNGSTASYWYALGRETDIAVSVPQSAASEALPALGSAITAATEEQ
ncbi:DUF3515 domain-containing protein [Corynebacterium yudongzhengii]|uniref:DUF3515 domain-containing protein n=1 Tax=Corynebacterium yudongzhengii TaxID=2080740 RepID=A0A2U1T953_9CORY|nr:DUF3515 domain-containing protein [Corynebacterium yudongzhengii]AWB82033.1 DUF3515 domain-containing protein [Corynebacterium yudongzhengii]PWC02537.1 DUF3515 domain-containing protein [Corynebacterium yudongzhengii]